MAQKLLGMETPPDKILRTSKPSSMPLELEAMQKQSTEVVAS